MDDVVLVVKEEGLRLMIKKLKGYLKEKGLEVNPKKSKVMRFGKRLEKLRKREVWKWGGEVVEIVREFEYLWFTFQRRSRKLCLEKGEEGNGNSSMGYRQKVVWRR